MALNPKVPALREAMEQVLTPEEQPQYEAHMPPGRSWRGSRRMASTYLRASKDSFSQTRSAKAVPRDNHTRRLQSTPFSRSYVVHSHAAKRLSARHCGHVLASIHRVNRCSFGRVNAKGALGAGTMGVADTSRSQTERTPRKCDCCMIWRRSTRGLMTRISCRGPGWSDKEW